MVAGAQVSGSRGGKPRRHNRLAVAASARLEAARLERASWRQRCRVGWLALDRRQFRFGRRVEMRDRCGTTRSCRGGAEPSNTSSSAPSSTIRPAYITRTRSAWRATRPRSCVMRTSAIPVSSRSSVEQLQDLRLHRDVERGGRLVGDQHLGPEGDRHGDQRALAHAAGKLMRIVVDAPLRVGDVYPLPAGDGLCAGRRARLMRRCARSTSTI